MFTKDKDGDLVNLLNLVTIINRGDFVEGVDSKKNFFTLYEGDNCQEYMSELEKELAAFGKMIRIEVGE